ncbi:hypothetical protein IFM89_032937 [Coptis chinensis]|uniref:Uncharacterized protein n=1 Tax=Coptis chinensis TaxID=261450 RepID=A0A835I7G0_9MAGN|nr:hypothetical protein IFM89_032937 [Coptis chinensis]
MRHLCLAGNENLTADCSELLQGSWPKIVVLNLAANSIYGMFPSSVGNMTSLVNLDLFFNDIEGGIPSSIGYLHNLKSLNMFGNSLTGELPKFLLKTKSCISASPLRSMMYLRLSEENGNRVQLASCGGFVHLSCPIGVKLEEWEKLVDNESKPLRKLMRTKGKVAREAVKALHTSGRKGAAKTVHDMKSKNPNVKVTRTDSYMAIHTHKDGSFIASERMERIKAIIEDDPASVNLDLDHDPVAQVCGPDKFGRVLGMSVGISKTALASSALAKERLCQQKQQHSMLKSVLKFGATNGHPHQDLARDKRRSGRHFKATGIRKNSLDMCDVGLDTQNAAETLEVLGCGVTVQITPNDSEGGTRDVMMVSFSAKNHTF